MGRGFRHPSKRQKIQWCPTKRNNRSWYFNFKCNHAENININDLIDGNIVRKILKNYLTLSKVCAASALKYLRIFKSFVIFVDNSLSPERQNPLRNTELIARSIKVEDVKLQIDTISFGLNKDVPTQQAVNRSRMTNKLLTNEEK